MYQSYGKPGRTKINNEIEPKEVFTNAAFYIFMTVALIMSSIWTMLAKDSGLLVALIFVICCAFTLPYAYATFIAYHVAGRENIGDLYVRLPENNTNDNLVKFRSIQIHTSLLFVAVMAITTWLFVVKFHLKDDYILMTSSAFFPIVLVYNMIIFSGISKLAFWLSAPFFVFSLLIPLLAYCWYSEDHDMMILDKLDLNGYSS